MQNPNSKGRVIEIRTKWPKKGMSTVKVFTGPVVVSELPEPRYNVNEMMCKRRHDFKDSEGNVDEAAWNSYKATKRCAGCRQLALDLYNHHKFHEPKPKVGYYKACIKRALAERRVSTMTIGDLSALQS